MGAEPGRTRTTLATLAAPERFGELCQLLHQPSGTQPSSTSGPETPEASDREGWRSLGTWRYSIATSGGTEETTIIVRAFARGSGTMPTTTSGGHLAPGCGPASRIMALQKIRKRAVDREQARMNTFDFVCSGASSPGPRPRRRSRSAGRPGTARNVNLRIADINRAMLTAPDVILLDLLRSSGLRLLRGPAIVSGSKLTEHGRDWRRAMNFIPVRQPALWASASVTDAFARPRASCPTARSPSVKATNPACRRGDVFPELVDGSFVPMRSRCSPGRVDSIRRRRRRPCQQRKRLALVGPPHVRRCSHPEG